MESCLQIRRKQPRDAVAKADGNGAFVHLFECNAARFLHFHLDNCGDFAGWEEAVVATFLDNLGRFVRDEPLRNVVDTTLGFGVG